MCETRKFKLLPPDNRDSTHAYNTHRVHSSDIGRGHGLPRAIPSPPWEIQWPNGHEGSGASGFKITLVLAPRPSAQSEDAVCSGKSWHSLEPRGEHTRLEEGHAGSQTRVYKLVPSQNRNTNSSAEWNWAGQDKPCSKAPLEASKRSFLVANAMEAIILIWTVR